MGAFTLGTVPGLLGVGWAGHLALRRRGALVRWAATALFLVNAATLAYLAVRAMP
ncbi:MAG: hypothetical protein WCF16_09470 [Alphaproteobacteria bacterium]